MAISLIVAIIGGLVYMVASRMSAADVAELGRLCFAVGLLAFLFGR